MLTNEHFAGVSIPMELKSSPTVFTDDGLTMSTNLTEEPKRELLVGVDVGNHFTKSVIQPLTATATANKVCIPSLLATDQVQQLAKGDPMTFRIASGVGRNNELYRIWSTDISYKPTQVVISDEKGCGKPAYALPLMISALWNDIEDGDLVYVVASVHDKAAYGATLESTLKGARTVEFTTADKDGDGGGVISKSFEIDVLGILYESAGVILSIPSDKRPVNTTILDIGGGTALIAPMQGAKMAFNLCEVPDGGLYSLHNAISNDEGVKSAIRHHSELCRYFELIVSRSGLIDLVRNKGRINIRGAKADLSELINPIIEAWLVQLDAKLRQNAGYQYLNDPHRKVYVTGGSANIQQVKTWAKCKGYTIVGDPQFANAIGLYNRAKALYTRKLA